MGKTSAYCEIFMNDTNTFRGQDAEFLYVKAGGAYSEQ
jgi:hypothetical protein